MCVTRVNEDSSTKRVDSDSLDKDEHGTGNSMLAQSIPVMQAWCWNVKMGGAYRKGVEKLLCVKEAIGLLAAAGDGCARFAQSAVANVAASSPSPNVINPALESALVTRRRALESLQLMRWMHAEAAELGSPGNNGDYEECELPRGRKAIATKFVYKTKRNDRTVICYKFGWFKGSTQVAGVNFTTTFSPWARFTSIRLVLAAMYRLVVH